MIGKRHVACNASYSDFVGDREGDDHLLQKVVGGYFFRFDGGDVLFEDGAILGNFAATGIRVRVSGWLLDVPTMG